MPAPVAPVMPQVPYQPGQMGQPGVDPGAQAQGASGGTEPIRPISLMPADPMPAPEPQQPPAPQVAPQDLPRTQAPPRPQASGSEGMSMEQLAMAADQASEQSAVPSPFNAIPYNPDLEDPSLASLSAKLEPGQMVDEYQITGMLGEGGMGIVYDGIQPVIGKRVAIKVLLNEFASNEKVVKRFIQEARAVNQIHSRYIVDIFSFGRLENGRPYFVMEHLEGAPLRDFIKERGTLSFDEAFAILRCVCKGLAAAHAEGIVHRDLKPENIIVQEEDGAISAKILDFGIAKLQTGPGLGIATQTGVAMGTPYYMSPEQVRGVDVDHLSDIYALGIIMFEMFTGSLPFTANSYIELVNKHLFTAPPIPSKLAEGIPRELEGLILGCIEKEKASRPQSMNDLFAVLVAMAPHATGMTFPSLAAPPAVPVTPETPTVQDPSQQYLQPAGPQFPAQQAAAAPYGPPVEQVPSVQPAPPPAKKSRAGLVIGLLLVLLVLAGGGGAGYYFLVHRAGGYQQAWAAWSGKLGVGGSDSPGDQGDGDTGGSPEDGDEEGTNNNATGGETKGGETKGGETKGGETKGGETRGAKLTVKANHPRAIYFMDGKQVGKGSKLVMDEVPAGKHQLKVTAPGRVAEVRDFVAEGGAILSYDLALKRKTGGRNWGKKGGTKKPDTKGKPDDEGTLNPFSGR